MMERDRGFRTIEIVVAYWTPELHMEQVKSLSGEPHSKWMGTVWVEPSLGTPALGTVPHQQPTPYPLMSHEGLHPSQAQAPWCLDSPCQATWLPPLQPSSTLWEWPCLSWHVCNSRKRLSTITVKASNSITADLVPEPWRFPGLSNLSAAALSEAHWPW